MPCSAVTLSLATITAIIATALLAIAFSTDNWLFIEVKRANILITAMKNKVAEDPGVNIPEVYHQQRNENTSEEIISSYPTYDGVKTILYRSKLNAMPKLPNNVQELSLMGEYTLTKRNQQFLLVDEIFEDGRIVIFCSLDSLSKLCASEDIFMDGTFKIVPDMFQQLYTIHGFYLGECFPFAYCLLTNKREITYIRVLNHLKAKSSHQKLEFCPKVIHVDFEAAAISASKLVFPAAAIKGCLFHYSQSIWRKVQQFGLVHLYNNNDDIRKWLRRCVAMPFVPLKSIDDVFMEVMEEAPEVQQRTQFHDYMVDTWIDNSALFEREVWNHYTTKRHRTTNLVEGWHSKINRKARKTHLNIYELVRLIKEEEHNTANSIMYLLLGNRPKQPRRKWTDLNEKIERLKNHLEQGEIGPLRYLDSISHALHME